MMELRPKNSTIEHGWIIGYNIYFRVGFDNSARSINFDNVTNSIYVGGNFSEYDNNTAANRLVRLSINGILDPTYDVGNGFSNTVYRTLFDNSGKLIVVGAFTSTTDKLLEEFLQVDVRWFS